MPNLLFILLLLFGCDDPTSSEDSEFEHAIVLTDEFGNIHNSKLVEFSMNPTNNVIITPHVGGMTWEGQTKAYKWAINKFKGVQNEVN